MLGRVWLPSPEEGWGVAKLQESRLPDHSDPRWVAVEHILCVENFKGSPLEVRPSSVAPDPAESRGAPPPPQSPLPSCLQRPAAGQQRIRCFWNVPGCPWAGAVLSLAQTHRGRPQTTSTLESQDALPLATRMET